MAVMDFIYSNYIKQISGKIYSNSTILRIARIIWLWHFYLDKAISGP